MNDRLSGTAADFVFLPSRALSPAVERVKWFLGKFLACFSRIGDCWWRGLKNGLEELLEILTGYVNDQQITLRARLLIHNNSTNLRITDWALTALSYRRSKGFGRDWKVEGTGEHWEKLHV
jgi:hypothetical protein